MQACWIAADIFSLFCTTPLAGEAGVCATAAIAAAPLRAFVHNMETRRTARSETLQCWSAGETTSLARIGPLGEAVAASRTLGQALLTFVDGFPILQSSTEIRLRLDEDEARIDYRILDPQIWPRRGDAELTMGLIWGIARHFCLPREALRHVAFEHAADRDPQGMERHLQRPLCFAADWNSIVLPRRALDLRNPAPVGTGGAHDDCRRRIDAMLAELRRGAPVARRVREQILRALDDAAPGQDRIAQRLGLSERTLRRALAQEGTSFKDIREECLRLQSHALLARSDRPLSEIALRLGYSDQTAFSRAFSRWYGVPPREFRLACSSEVRAIA